MTGVNPNDLAPLARHQTRLRFGADLAEKATDAFCINLVGPSLAAAGRPRSRWIGGPRQVLNEYRARTKVFLARPSSLQVVGPGLFRPSRVAPTVIEFDPSGVWSDVASALADVVDTRRDTGSQAEHRGNSAVARRQALIRSVREASMKAFGSTMDYLDGALADRAGGVDPIFLDRHLTQTCWLNRTILTLTAPEILSEVASHPAVSRLDVPRRLQREGTLAPNLEAIGFGGYAAGRGGHDHRDPRRGGPARSSLSRRPGVPPTELLRRGLGTPRSARDCGRVPERRFRR